MIIICISVPCKTKHTIYTHYNSAICWCFTINPLICSLGVNHFGKNSNTKQDTVLCIL